MLLIIMWLLFFSQYKIILIVCKWNRLYHRMCQHWGLYHIKLNIVSSNRIVIVILLSRVVIVHQTLRFLSIYHLKWLGFTFLFFNFIFRIMKFFLEKCFQRYLQRFKALKNLLLSLLSLFWSKNCDCALKLLKILFFLFLSLIFVQFSAKFLGFFFKFNCDLCKLF